MKAFEEIQQLWNNRQDDPRVDFDELMKGIKGSRKALAAKFMWQCVTIGIAVALLIAVVVWVDFVTWTAYAGIWIIVACLLYYLANQWKDFRSIEQSEKLFATPQQYVIYLKAFQVRRNRFNTYNYTIYEACVALALALYAVEFYYLLPTLVFAVFVGFVVVWFLVCHFVFMRRYIRNENARIDAMIADLRRIADQFAE